MSDEQAPEPELSIADVEARALVHSARQVIADAIRLHPIGQAYYSEASIEAHAAGIVVALTLSGHLR